MLETRKYNNLLPPSQETQWWVLHDTKHQKESKEKQCYEETDTVRSGEADSADDLVWPGGTF